MNTGSLAEAIERLQAGDWPRAHAIVQQDESPLACWAHGIVHVMEGDRDNARYWYGRARRAWPGDFDLAAELAALDRAARDRAGAPEERG